MVMPVRWYTERTREDHNVLCGKGWLMEARVGVSIEDSGWIIQEHTAIEFRCSELLWAFPMLESLADSLSMPPIHRILGKFISIQLYSAVN